MRYWLIFMLLLLPCQARAADLVGITTATITSYIPGLQVKRVKNLTFRGQINSQRVMAKYHGMYGPWKDSVETAAARKWMKTAGILC